MLWLTCSNRVQRKVGIIAEPKKAAWEFDYLLEVLSQRNAIALRLPSLRSHVRLSVCYAGFASTSNGMLAVRKSNDAEDNHE